MTNQPSEQSTASSSGATGTEQRSRSDVGRNVSPRPGGEGVLVTEHGRTSIADTVVTKIAALAARQVSGVYKLGGGTARAFGAIRERIPGASSNVAQGVAVEVGERQAAVDLDVMVEYGVAIADLSAAIRRNVISSIERMTGLQVTEVNIMVDDIHIPGDDSTDDDESGDRVSRVQ